jgi:hypothetical protein
VKQYAPFTYDAANLLISAMQKAGQRIRPKYLPSLASMSYDGASGHIEFDAKGDRKDAEMTISRTEDGKVEPIAIIGRRKSTKVGGDTAAAPAAPAAAAPAPAPAATPAPTPPRLHRPRHHRRSNTPPPAATPQHQERRPFSTRRRFYGASGIALSCSKARRAGHLGSGRVEVMSRPPDGSSERESAAWTSFCSRSSTA